MKKLLLTLTTFFVASATSFCIQAQELKGDAKAGESKNAMCIGCHGIVGYQATFPEIYKVPMISGQSAKFIASALHAYKTGERKHPTMRGIAESLSDQDMADLAAYYEAHGKAQAAAAASKPVEPSPTVSGLIAKGGCLACHGEGFNKPIDPSYPKVAGQHADYLFVALKSYKTEGHATWGRANPIMGGMAKQFSNDELKLLAAYVHSLPGELKTVPQSHFR
jgi:cytochrome c553